MARIHGQKGRLYVQLTPGTGSAEPIAFISKWSMDRSTDRADVTAYEDGNKVSVAGKESTSGSFSGFYDTETEQLYDHAGSASASRWYFYPVATNSAQYFYGDGFFDFSLDFPVDGPGTVSGSWSASSDVTKKSS